MFLLFLLWVQMNRIEENAVIDSCHILVIPIVGPGSGMQYGVDKLTLREKFSSEPDLILILLWYLFW